MSLSIIVAMTEDRVIGRKGKLPWNIPEELDLFKKITKGNTVLMGRKTWESLPDNRRPLPNRKNVIVTKNPGDFDYEGIDFCGSFERGFVKAESYGKEVFVIGGESMYLKALPISNKLYISHIKGSYEGDTFFPSVDWNNWSCFYSKEYKDFVHKIYRKI